MGLRDWLFGKKCKKCNDSRTKNSSGVCDLCELELEAEKETKVICPKCRVEMRKEILEEEIIIDRCPKCIGVFLGKGELRLLQDIAESEASSNHSSGLMLGMAMGSAMSHHR